MDGTSLDISADLVSQLKAIIPQAFTEDKIDFKQLQTLLGQAVNTDSERYQLSWAGKSEGYKVLQRPTTATLIPQPDDSISWDDAEHVFIEGENLEVLKVLQKSYYGKIKMIYIDPPYNTGNDSFIYPDKFSETKEEYLKRISDKDEEGYMLKEGLFRKNSRENGQFHSNWLNMMLPRLFLARNLLKDDGIIFVSIDDNEQANLKLLMDEVFGAENFMGCLIWRRRTSSALADKNISQDHEYVICFQKGPDFPGFIGQKKDYSSYKNPDNDPRGDWTLGDLTVGMTKDQRPNQFYELTNPDTKKVYPANANRVWAYIPESMDKLIQEKKVFFPDDITKRPMLKRFKENLRSENNPLSTYMEGVGLNTEATKTIQELFGAAYFNYSKPLSLMDTLIKNTTTDTDIILDFFAGSGTTAQAVLERNEQDGGNRKYICVQMPEQTEAKSEAYSAGYKTIADITKERLKRVIEKIKSKRSGSIEFLEPGNLGFRKYVLADSNFKIWRGDVIEDEDDLKAQLKLFTNPERANAQTENILWELLIKSGVQLTEKLDKIALSDDEIIYHTQNKRFAFVLDGFTPAIQQEILKLKPKTVVCLDSLFTGRDNEKTNAHLKFEDSGITFKTI